DGRARAGEISVNGALPAGRTVLLWVDAAGFPTGPPPSRRVGLASEDTAAVVAIGALGIVLLCLAGAGRWVLDRRRLAGGGEGGRGGKGDGGRSALSGPDASVPAASAMADGGRLLTHHGSSEAILRHDHVIVVVLADVELDPVHGAGEGAVFGGIVVAD